MPLSTYSGGLDVKGVTHLLRRLTFGPTMAQITTYVNANATPQTIVADCFNTAAAAPLPIDPATNAEWVTKPLTGANSKNADLEKYFIGWHIGQMLNTSLPYSAREKIVFFLHTHFTTIKSKVSSPRALYFQNELFRKFAIDGGADAQISIKELAKKICVDNAMIRLLDGDLNVKGNPNENFARELLELYTIGKGLDLEGSGQSLPPLNGYSDYKNYSELDVQQAALVFSGWQYDNDLANIDPITLLPRATVKGGVNNASSHDNTVKTFSYHFGTDAKVTPNATPATQDSALDEIDQFIELVFNQFETAKNICRKIYRFYCNREITESIDNDIIQSMATILHDNQYKIQPVLEALLTSTHFFFETGVVDDDKFGGIIKSPLDLAVGTLRLFDYQLPDMTGSTTSFFAQMSNLVDAIDLMGMPLYEPYDVAGYEAYHQWPVFHRAWITPNYLATRYRFIYNLTSIMPPDDKLVKISTYDWIDKYMADKADIVALPKEIAQYVFSVPLAEGKSGITDARYNYFTKQGFQGNLSGKDDAYWANLWGADIETLRYGTSYLINAMLQSPEYQLQ